MEEESLMSAATDYTHRGQEMPLVGKKKKSGRGKILGEEVQGKASTIYINLLAYELQILLAQKDYDSCCGFPRLILTSWLAAQD